LTPARLDPGRVDSDSPGYRPGVPHSPRIPRHRPHGWSSPPRGVAPIRPIPGPLRRICCALRSGVDHLRRIVGPLLLGVVDSDFGAAGAGRKADGARSRADGSDLTRFGPRPIRKATGLDAAAWGSHREEASSKADRSRSGTDVSGSAPGRAAPTRSRSIAVLWGRRRRVVRYAHKLTQIPGLSRRCRDNWLGTPLANPQRPGGRRTR